MVSSTMSVPVRTPMRGRPFLLLLLFINVLGCGSSGSDEPEKLAFTVDPELLGATFRDGSRPFSVQAPLGWADVPGEMLDEANRLLAERSDGSPQATLVALYRSEELRAHLTIGRHRAESQRDSVIQWHARRMKQSIPDGKINRARFSHRECEIDQFMVAHQQSVVVTLFAYHPEHELYQLDYVLPRQSYEQELRALESSIGSLSFKPEPEGGQSYAP